MMQGASTPQGTTLDM